MPSWNGSLTHRPVFARLPATCWACGWPSSPRNWWLLPLPNPSSPWRTGPRPCWFVPSPHVREVIAPFAWQSVSVGERVYGYPIAMEVVSLLYNKDLVSTPPNTLTEVAELDRELRARGARAIAWDYLNVYFSWPVFAGSGGYSFGARDFVYDLSDVGVATDGAIEA